MEVTRGTWGLEGRTAIVTGAAQGIGAAYAAALAAAGAWVAVWDVADPRSMVKKLEVDGGEAWGESVDITDEAAVAAATDRVIDLRGSVDILVNNAALFSTLELAGFEEVTIDEFRRVLEVNVIGQFICARAVLPSMRKEGWGRIVNVSSGAAIKGLPRMLPYVSSKGAIITFTRGLAREVGKWGVTVNALAPGLTMSESVQRHPDYKNAPAQFRAIDRPETPADLVGTVLWLCSDAAEFVTGQTIAVDGGSVML